MFGLMSIGRVRRGIIVWLRLWLRGRRLLCRFRSGSRLRRCRFRLWLRLGLRLRRKTATLLNCRAGRTKSLNLSASRVNHVLPMRRKFHQARRDHNQQLGVLGLHVVVAAEDWNVSSVPVRHLARWWFVEMYIPPRPSARRFSSARSDEFPGYRPPEYYLASSRPGCST